MNKEEIKAKTLEIAKIIHKKGGNSKSTLSLIRNNPNLLNMNPKVLENQLYLIINHSTVYAILFVEENDYYWSVLEHEEFGPLISSKAHQENNDYIIDMMIESVNKYFSYQAPEEKQTLEEDLKTFSSIRKNEEGYHLK